MANIYKNITGNSAIKVGVINIISLSLANVHATDAAVVDLYINNLSTATTSTKGLPRGTDWTPVSGNVSNKVYYILKSVTIPFGTTLVLDEEDVRFDANKYALMIKLAAADGAVDVIIRGDSNINRIGERRYNNMNNKSNIY